MLKVITNPATGKQFKMGRTRPFKTPATQVTFRDLLKANVLPVVTVPKSTNYSTEAAKSLHNIYGNDVLGDCVIAGGYHVRGLSSFNSGQGVTFTNAQVIEDYSAIGGYNPNAPLVNGQNPTDNGCDENTALAYWQNTGFPDGLKLLNSVSVDATNISEVRLAMYLFENLFFGVELPDAWVNPMPSGGGFTWTKEGPPDPSNGHCFVGCDLVPNGIKLSTWGFCGWLENNAIEYYAAPAQNGQLFTLLTPDIISRVNEKSPAGYNITDLTNYLAQL
jgi:hypothetical protein